MKFFQNGILKGNQIYAYLTRSIKANSIFKVQKENNEIIGEETFPKKRFIFSFFVKV